MVLKLSFTVMIVLLTNHVGQALRVSSMLMSTTTRERTKNPPKWKEGVRTGPAGDSNSKKNPSRFEYLIDEDARRDAENFHILMMGTTFDKPRMSVSYAAGALCLVLSMPEPEAIEHSNFAAEQGMSNLGTWPRDQCLRYGEQLESRDISVRVVPGVRGKQSWQGNPANANPEGLQPAEE
uniref:Uncharacterized protein n=1 Tax=Aureoumbra lagunensis TaxID=44058 RepID=A0A7S3NR81_9STRA|mmetsp:Transcript_21977/g.33911  ORF Transcript_21977/g.33911 Transcript_21977/m.33911 type:complete len:180 (-) Transcript_21977:167-706(-)